MTIQKFSNLAIPLLPLKKKIVRKYYLGLILPTNHHSLLIFALIFHKTQKVTCLRQEKKKKQAWRMCADSNVASICSLCTMGRCTNMQHKCLFCLLHGNLSSKVVNFIKHNAQDNLRTNEDQGIRWSPTHSPDQSLIADLFFLICNMHFWIYFPVCDAISFFPRSPGIIGVYLEVAQGWII